MAPSQIIDDYYQILDVPQSAGRDAIRTKYKKLAFKYHPDRNPQNPQATAQFQLLEAAYSTLFDTERRRVYDLQYVFIKLQCPTSPETKRDNPSSPTNTQEPGVSKYYELRIEQVGAALEELQQQKRALENELHNAQRECYNSQSALNELCADEFRDLDMQREIDRSGWFGYFFSARETKEEKLARRQRMDNYKADLRLRYTELQRHRNRVNATNSSLNALNEHIKNSTFEKEMLQREAAQMAETERQEAARVARIQRREAARMANNKRQQAMREERTAKAREETERMRKEQEAERERKEQEAERIRIEQEAERERKEQEAERIRKEQEAERMRKKQPDKRELKEQEAETMSRAQDVRNAIEELLQKHREEMRDKGLNTTRKAETGKKGHTKRRRSTKKT